MDLLQIATGITIALDLLQIVTGITKSSDCYKLRQNNPFCGNINFLDFIIFPNIPSFAYTRNISVPVVASERQKKKLVSDFVKSIVVCLMENQSSRKIA